MSEWRDLRNRQALVRLNRALPEIFPQPVLTHALKRAFTPPMPRLAVDSYWRGHPVRADRLARSLAARSGTPADWRWQCASDDMADAKPSRMRRKGSRQPGIMRGVPTFRTPPAPYREQRFALGPGFLLRVRPTGLSVRLAHGPMGQRPQHKCGLACRLHRGLGLVDRTERLRCGSAPIAARPLRGRWRAAVEDGRDRSPRPAVPGLA